MALRERLYTAEEFFAIAALPENEERRLELDEGEIVEVASSTQLNSVTAMRIGYFFNAYVIPRSLGYVSGADGGYKLGAKRARQPDVAFISKTRHTQLKGVNFPIAPDLAVEVVSEDEDVFKKAREYIEAGTRIVWAVYAEEKKVFVFRSNEARGFDVQTYTLEDVLDGGVVLPEFKLPVKDIFPD